MKAIVLKAFGSTANFSLEDISVPMPKGDEVLIRIKATAFNPIDYQMRLGRKESELMHSPVLGRELAGIVEATGDEVQNFKPGDEVYSASGSSGSNGTYATHITITEKRVALKPRNISFEQAAAIPSAGLTAWQTFTRLNVKKEESIFIAGGSGAVGSFLIKLLKAGHSNQIITTAGHPESAAALKILGLQDEQILNYKNSDLSTSAVHANRGNDFDYAADLAGGVSSEVAASVLKVNGSYADITFLGTPTTRALLFDKGATILNISNYAFALSGRLSWYGETLSHLKALTESNGLTAPAIHIAGSFSVKTVQEAHHLMENNLTKGKKPVMTMD